MRFGSLFAGIGGLDLGLERAGHECRWQVEIDPFCRKVLAKHWPDVPKYEDVRDVGSENLEPVDLICGGFPCQDVSQAGARAGIDGERSGLWSEYARIIGELRPGYVLVENVPGLLSSGMGRVLGDLAALGYDAEWESLPAAAVGAPHLRDRVFILAYAHAQPLTAQRGKREAAKGSCAGRGHIGSRGPRSLERQEPVRRARQDPALLSDPQGLWQLECWRGERPEDGREAGDVDFWRREPMPERVADGVPARMDRLRGLGNAVVPQVAEWIGRRLPTEVPQER